MTIYQNKYQNRKTEAKTKRQMNTNESLIMNSEHQPLVLFSVVNQVMLKSYPTVTYFVVAVNNKQTVSLTLLRPGQTLVTFQRNILQHCCMMLRHVLNGVAKRTQHFHHFQRNMSMFMCPWPLARNKWT